MGDFNNFDFGFSEDTPNADDIWGQTTMPEDTPTSADDIWGSPQEVSNDAMPSDDFTIPNTEEESWISTPETLNEDSEVTTHSPTNDVWGQTTNTDWNKGVSNEPSFEQFGNNTTDFSQMETAELHNMNSDADNVDVLNVAKNITNKMTKRTGLIILAVGLLFVSLIIFYFAGTKVHKKPQVDTTQTTTQVQQDSNVQVQPDNTQVQQENAQSSQVASNISSNSFIEIPEDTIMNYDSDILEITGKITNKSKYLYGNQVLYNIEITAEVGASSQKINYFCNYGSFMAVKPGDVVIVKYQQIADGYISVISISQ